MQQCPRCMTDELKYPIELNAISSHDEKTWICADCGVEESRINFFISKDRIDKIPFQAVAKEKYFCKKLGVECRVG